jgi:RNA polymerase sigma-70 factor (ECF subfamily)
MGSPGAGRAALGDVESAYRAHLSEFRRVAAAISGDRGAAPDLVQEAFLRAVRELDRFEGRGSLEGWLWRIVVNVAKNHRRDGHPSAELRSDLVGPPSQVSDVDGVRAAVGRLPERQRVVLFLRYYADLDYGAIAEAAGISAGTVAATLHSARASLEQLLSSSEAAS